MSVIDKLDRRIVNQLKLEFAIRKSINDSMVEQVAKDLHISPELAERCLPPFLGRSSLTYVVSKCLEEDAIAGWRNEKVDGKEPI